MFPMKRILFPVDFTARSTWAAKYAVALKCRSQAELNILHVAPGHGPRYDVNDVCLPPAYALEIAWDEARLTEAEDKMKEFIDSHFHGVPVRPCIRTGDAAR